LPDASAWLALLNDCSQLPKAPEPLPAMAALYLHHARKEAHPERAWNLPCAAGVALRARLHPVGREQRPHFRGKTIACFYDFTHHASLICIIHSDKK
jgi:hypothetical protein